MSCRIKSFHNLIEILLFVYFYETHIKITLKVLMKHNCYSKFFFAIKVITRKSTVRILIFRKRELRIRLIDTVECWQLVVSFVADIRPIADCTEIDTHSATSDRTLEDNRKSPI